MDIKFIQVNIFKGKYLDSLIRFLKKENPDFISMQEVTVGQIGSYKDKSANIFEILKAKLELKGIYNGDLIVSDMDGATFGNAVFSRFPIKDSRVVTLKTFRPVLYDEVEGSNAKNVRPLFPRHLLDAICIFNGRRIHVMSWHGAWTAPPVDSEEVLKQARKVSDYIKGISEPFILGCDSNNIPQSKTVGLVNNVARNLMVGQNIKQTTHPKVHKIAPKGFLVDYVFTSEHFRLRLLSVPQVLVSDHLPVVANLEM